MDEVITAADASSSLRSYSSESSALPPNLPLLSAFLSLFIAQFLKVFTHWYVLCISVRIYIFVSDEIWFLFGHYWWLNWAFVRVWDLFYL